MPNVKIMAVCKDRLPRLAAKVPPFWKLSFWKPDFTVRKPITEQTKKFYAVLSVLLMFAVYTGMCVKQKHFNSMDTTIPNVEQFGEGIVAITKPHKLSDHSPLAFFFDPAPFGTWKFKTAIWEVEGEIPYPKFSEWEYKSHTWGEWGNEFHLRWKQFWSAWIVEDTWATYGRHFVGMFFGVLLALLVGMLMGVYPRAEAFFFIPVTLFARLPPTAMLAVYFVLFGMELKMYIAMIAFGIFPTLAQSIFQSARKDVAEDLINKGYTLGASNMEAIWNIIFKTIYPRVLDSIRLCVGPALVFLLAAEFAMADIGFGYRIRIQSRLSNMNVVFIYLAILAVTGYYMDKRLLRYRRKVCKWFGE